ncbi:MSCRAMM family protein [Streptomyces sp. NPDC001889]
MSVAPSPTHSQTGRRFRRPVVAATAAALGAGILLAPSASAADKWGPGYLIADASGKPDASHIGAYGAPGQTLPGVKGLAYCADPTLDGPQAADGYGPAKEYTTWTSVSGKKASAESIARAAYILAKYGQTSDDSQAAAVDAALYTHLEAGSTYALPGGKRALQRLSYPNVSPSAKTKATQYLAEADKYAGPYKLNIKPTSGSGDVKPGTKTDVTLDVTSAAGHKVPGVKLKLDLSGAATGTLTATTGADGTATATLTPVKDGTATLKATAASLPGTALNAILPENKKAQRMLVQGTPTSATAELQLKVIPLKGGIKVAKTAADSGKPLAGVEFEVKDSAGKTLATGKTDAAGHWTATGLAPGSYTVHEVRAVPGYQLAPDQTVTVTDGKDTPVAVKDVRIPEPEKPKPRPVTIKELPKTGA